MSRTRSFQIVAAVIVLVFIARELAQAFVPLMPEEAYYWMYWQHPNLSYFDHPPMVAWVIGLGTQIFGNNEWGVRVVGSVMMLFNALLMYRFVRMWWSRLVAIISVLMIQLTPVYFGIGFLATMDSALLTYWLICLLGFSFAVRRNKTWGWYVAGFGLGGAMLSKYTGVMLVPGVGMLLLFRREWRAHLKSIHPYLSLLIGVTMCWPVWVWNAQHDWVSFRFQFLSRFEEIRHGHEHSVLEFIGAQIALATPMVLLGTAILIKRGLRHFRMTPRNAMALSFGLPLIVSIGIKSWTYPVHIGWTAPAYIVLIPAAVHLAFVLARRSGRSALWNWRSGAIVQTLAICSIINVCLIAYLLLIQPHTRWIHAFGPWDDISSAVERCEDKMEHESGREPLIIADGRYELASELAFYRTTHFPDPDNDDTPWLLTTSQDGIGDFGVGYKYWVHHKDWIGRDCLFVDMNDRIEKDLPGKFRTVTVVWEGPASDGRNYRIAECREMLN